MENKECSEEEKASKHTKKYCVVSLLALIIIGPAVSFFIISAFNDNFLFIFLALACIVAESTFFQKASSRYKEANLKTRLFFRITRLIVAVVIVICTLCVPVLFAVT